MNRSQNVPTSSNLTTSSCLTSNPAPFVPELLQLYQNFYFSSLLPSPVVPWFLYLISCIQHISTCLLASISRTSLVFWKTSQIYCTDSKDFFHSSNVLYTGSPKGDSLHPLPLKGLPETEGHCIGDYCRIGWSVGFIPGILLLAGNPPLLSGPWTGTESADLITQGPLRLSISIAAHRDLLVYTVLG